MNPPVASCKPFGEQQEATGKRQLSLKEAGTNKTLTKLNVLETTHWEATPHQASQLRSDQRVAQSSKNSVGASNLIPAPRCPSFHVCLPSPTLPEAMPSKPAVFNCKGLVLAYIWHQQFLAAVPAVWRTTSAKKQSFLEPGERLLSLLHLVMTPCNTIRSCWTGCTSRAA